ncbi:MAG: malate synthase G, partial [Rhodospirillales bacterium]|nr:malate synthase G [Rhodospirillales bacterium]
MTDRMAKNGLHVAKELVDFTEHTLLLDSGIRCRDFWRGFAEIITDLAPKNKELLLKRATLQAKIDAWHLERKGQDHDEAAYKSFLTEIGYLVPEGGTFQIETAGVDPEIAAVAGAQLVVPVSNARFALNAANARWGSLYDA